MNDFDLSPVDPLPGTMQSLIKSDLAKAFVSANIITAIEIDSYGRIEIKAQTWDEYWDIRGNIPAADSFTHFEKARNEYFQSGFKSDYIREYCFSFFTLLVKWLNHRKESKSKELLSKLLSLENFVIRWHNKEPGMAAGTTSHRNPAYLLSRLGKTTFNEDPKYLPLIMLSCSSDNNLFYHYRQYRISNEPNFSIFTYPAASLNNRGKSFALIESFTRGFSRKSDPRSKQRAQLLAETAIHPFLKFSLAKDNDKKEVNIVDIGSGSGIMLKHLWEHILSKDSDAKENWYLNGSLIGLRVHNPARHFSKGPIRKNMAYLDYQQIDYVDWINKQTELLKFDVILMCRLLNNISQFDIEHSDDEGMLWFISGQQYSPDIIVSKKYNPVHCLTPEKYCPGNLIHTNGRTRLSENSSAYRVLSLTDYYKAIAFCLGRDINDELFFYPVRKFNENSLLNYTGQSIIGKLSSISKLTVIEDIDLTANYLFTHIKNFKLDIAANAINSDSQYSSQVLAVYNKKYANILPGAKLC